MNAERLPNGNILIPIRAEDESGRTIGDAMIEIGPDHPNYEKWYKYLKAQNEYLQ